MTDPLQPSNIASCFKITRPRTNFSFLVLLKITKASLAFASGTN
jgi:hypothetical protein